MKKEYRDYLRKGELKKLVVDAGFKWDIMNPPNQCIYRNTNMTWSHAKAIAYTLFQAKLAGLNCFTELEHTCGKKADCFILPTELSPRGLVVQWESHLNWSLVDRNEGFFPDVSVRTFDYLNFRDDESTHTEQFLIEKWNTKLQIPIPPEKFRWSEWWKLGVL